MTELELEAVKITAMILSTEGWAKSYFKAPDQHKELIDQTAKFTVLLTKFFKEMAKDAPNFVNWDHYNYQVSLDYKVDVIVNGETIANWDTNFIKVNYKVINNLIAAGAVAGQETYNIPLGIQSTDAIIQQLSLKQIAGLVGKSVAKDGSIIDNPNPAYDVLDTVRNDIMQSVKTSLATGATTDEAIADMQTVISNPARAVMIANTESVNAYQAGLSEFASQSDAVGKEWETADDPCDICQANADEGPIAIDDTFDSGDDEPTAHPNCLCGDRLIYQQEWDGLQG